MDEYDGQRNPQHKMTVSETNNKNRLIVSAVKCSRENRHLAENVRQLPPAGAFENDFLTALSAESLKNLLPFLESVRLSAGERIYDAGNQIDFVYFPETAVISELRTLETGKALEIAMIGKEGAAGLLFLFSSAHSINRAQILVSGSAYRVRRHILKNLMSSDIGLQNTVLHFINNYVGQITRRAACQKFHSIEQRICSWLMMIQNRRRVKRLRVTQEQFSMCLGVLRPSLGTIARELKERKIIDYSRGK